MDRLVKYLRNEIEKNKNRLTQEQLKLRKKEETTELLYEFLKDKARFNVLKNYSYIDIANALSVNVSTISRHVKILESRRRIELKRTHRNRPMDIIII